jgi:hypothetical protein
MQPTQPPRTTWNTSVPPRRRAEDALRFRKGVSTALLLPGLHPWLKSFVAHHDLIAIENDAPLQEEWSSNVVPLPTTNTATLIALHYGFTPLNGSVITLFTNEEKLLDAPTALIAPKCEELPVPKTPTRPLAPSVQPAPRIQLAPPPKLLPIAPRVVVPAPSPRPDIAVIPRQVISEKNSRTSTAPTPFSVPLYAREDTHPSRHILRVGRPQHIPPQPDLLDRLEERLHPVRAQIERAGPQLADRYRTWKLSRHNGPAPTPSIPMPYSDLLVVQLAGGVIGPIWRTIAWPAWQIAHLPSPYTLHASLLHALRKLQQSLRPSPFHIPGAQRLRSSVLPSLPSLNVRHLALRHAFSFAAVLLFVITPIKLLHSGAIAIPETKGRVLGATTGAISTLRDGGNAAAQQSFTAALDAFAEARTALESLPNSAGLPSKIGFAVGRLLPGVVPTFDRAQAGREALLALTDASSATTRALTLLDAVDPDKENASQLLDASRAAFSTAYSRAAQARNLLASVAPSLLPTIDIAMQELQRATSLVPITGALAGLDRPRRILLVFQNPAELRATGGFIGSVGIVDVKDGRATSFELPTGGSYDVSGMSRVRVLPPDPLRLVQSTWQFHDANWFPDFPTTARKLQWFLEASGGPSVDAVIAVNAPVLSDILELTGPISVGSNSFGASDVLSLLTNTIESHGARMSGAPKTIIADLAPRILERLTSLSSSDDSRVRIALLDRFLRALDERDVLLAFQDDDIQRTAVRAGWDGGIRQTSGDALMVVHTNIGGGKSDAVTRDSITHTATIDVSGTITDTVRITRSHEGATPDAGAPALGRLQAMQNVDYLRVYVPRGAELLSTEGFDPVPSNAFYDIPADALPDEHLLAAEKYLSAKNVTVQSTEEFGRTTFGGWMFIPQGEQRTVSLTYRLPWKYDRETANVYGITTRANAQGYTFLAQQQPGTKATLQHSVIVSPDWRVSWVSDNLSEQEDGIWLLQDHLTNDRFSGIMIEP